MKSVRYWRLWHRLFGWDYAQVVSVDEEDNPGPCYILRARRLYNGRRYVQWWNGNLFLDELLDDDWLPLTPFDTDRDLKDYADLVQKQLQEE